MKKYICQLFFFIIIIVIIDIVFGQTMTYLLNHAKGGYTWRNNYICKKTNENILIFGSSRAIHHYNPQIINDSLDMSCYNCGQNGYGIILNYGRLLLIHQRYQPKVIIYDIYAHYDYLENDNRKYLGQLKPYYHEIGIKNIFDSIDQIEKWKMQSAMYRYNSRFLQIISDYFHPLKQTIGINGFKPKENVFNSMKTKKYQDKDEYNYDKIKIDYLKKFITLCKNSTLIFTFSPIWYNYDQTKLKVIKEICKEYNIHFLDFSNDPKYIHNNQYFNDGLHLNAKGADEFTRDLIKRLRPILENSDKHQVAHH